MNTPIDTIALSTEDLQARLGQVLGASPWFVIDQRRIDLFADVTEDHQFIHTDPARATDSPFGTTIAHGFLTLSMLSAMLERAEFHVGGTVMSVNYGFDRVRFLSPVPVASRVRAIFTLLRLNRRPEAIDTCVEVTVHIEGHDKPALVAEWITRHYLEERP